MLASRRKKSNADPISLPAASPAVANRALLYAPSPSALDERTTTATWILLCCLLLDAVYRWMMRDLLCVCAR